MTEVYGPAGPGEPVGQLRFDWAERSPIGGGRGWGVAEVVDVDESVARTVSDTYAHLLRAGGNADADALVVALAAGGWLVGRRYGAVMSSGRAQTVAHVLVGLATDRYDLPQLLALEEAPFWRPGPLARLTTADLDDAVAAPLDLPENDGGLHDVAVVVTALLRRGTAPLLVDSRPRGRAGTVRVLRAALALVPTAERSLRAVSTYEPTPPVDRAAAGLVAVCPEAEAAITVGGRGVGLAQDRPEPAVLRYVTRVAESGARLPDALLDWLGNRATLEPGELLTRLVAEFEAVGDVRPGPTFRPALPPSFRPEWARDHAHDVAMRERVVAELGAGALQGAEDLRLAVAALAGTPEGDAWAGAALDHLVGNRPGNLVDDRVLIDLAAGAAGDNVDGMVRARATGPRRAWRLLMACSASTAPVPTANAATVQLGTTALTDLADRVASGRDHIADLLTLAGEDPSIGPVVLGPPFVRTHPWLALGLLRDRRPGPTPPAVGAGHLGPGTPGGMGTGSHGRAAGDGWSRSRAAGEAWSRSKRAGGVGEYGDAEFYDAIAVGVTDMMVEGQPLFDEVRDRAIAGLGHDPLSTALARRYLDRVPDDVHLAVELVRAGIGRLPGAGPGDALGKAVMAALLPAPAAGPPGIVDEERTGAAGPGGAGAGTLPSVAPLYGGRSPSPGRPGNGPRPSGPPPTGPLDRDAPEATVGLGTGGHPDPDPDPDGSGNLAVRVLIGLVATALTLIVAAVAVIGL